MCSALGRCPCWPREELFDAAEMHILGVLKDNMVYTTPADYSGAFRGSFRGDLYGNFLVALQGACASVRRSRLAYVLSTFVQIRDLCSVTALQFLSTENEFAKWLLQVGVCPDMGLFHPRYNGFRALYRGWDGGPRHPGRPLQLYTKTVLQHSAPFFLMTGSSVLSLHTGRTLSPPRTMGGLWTHLSAVTHWGGGTGGTPGLPVGCG
jgi:hypothetical protein